MANDKMIQCERKVYNNDVGQWEWVEAVVANLPDKGRVEVRCRYCHGRVRVHKRRVAHGPKDHVEHYHRQDSENCPGGSLFKGNPKLSSMPIE